MLAMSDTSIEQFLPVFANTGTPVAFLVPTPTGYGKSIMDATNGVRELLKNSGVHDYAKQGQGQENKVLIESYFVGDRSCVVTEASLYRPITKKGDPRIWFSNLKKYCEPCNLLALIVISGRIYVINLSNPLIVSSLQSKGYVYDVILESVIEKKQVAVELREKIQAIHDKGFLRSITPGDPGVGDTLEHALGINRNNSREPDYKGIELKASRLTRNGEKRQTTRQTLFAKVPDEGMTYRQIVDNYGKVQIPKNMTVARLQMYETLRYSRPNAYDLLLELDSNKDLLKIMHEKEEVKKYVSAWYLQTLRDALKVKHHETFWVKAESINHDGIEYFRYDKILHTKNPNVSLIEPLIEADKITVDIAAHYLPNGKWRDHGMLFKMLPDDLPLLLGEAEVYDLTR